MNEKLNVPKKIVVGYQYRDDTYTGKLAYVIYRNEKGKLAKETSWRGWIHDGPQEQYARDENNQMIKEITGPGQYDYNWKMETVPGIPTDEWDNEPIEGFVLNRNGGGKGSGWGWNDRNAFIRVWDPRGFEFEISIPNLLFILQYSSSMVGKGLSGKFVYAWEGPNLVLLPENCAEYKSSVEFTDLKSMKVSAKEYIPGATYYTKQMKNVVYIGRMLYFSNQKGYNNNPESYLEISHVFSDGDDQFMKMNTSEIAKCLDQTPVPNLAELIEKGQKLGVLASPDMIFLVKDTPIKWQEHTRYGSYSYRSNGQYEKYYTVDSYSGYTGLLLKTGDNEYAYHEIKNINPNGNKRVRYGDYVSKYETVHTHNITLNGNEILIKKLSKPVKSREYTKEEVDFLSWKQIFIKLPNDKHEYGISL